VIRNSYGQMAKPATVNFPLHPKPDARFGVETSRVVGGPRVPALPASQPITPNGGSRGQNSALGLSLGITGKTHDVGA